jgi:hypothetical protein
VMQIRLPRQAPLAKVFFEYLFVNL